jgi:hypothetical protein
MNQLFILAVGFAAGYWIATRVIPAAQVKIEAKVEELDLDSAWDVWDTEEWA